MAEKLKLPCPNCKNTKTRKKGCSNRGKQKWFCPACNKYWDFGEYEGESKMIQQVRLKWEKSKNKLICPCCNSLRTRKSGFEPGTKKQRYHCRNCNKVWVDGRNYEVNSALSANRTEQF